MPPSPRNPRNRIYPGNEDLPAVGGGHILVRFWRMRTEFLLVAMFAAVTMTLLGATREGRWLPFVLLSSVITLPAATRTGRNWAVAHLWCLVSRHRLQRVCLETTMHTRTGRIPLVLWITPTRTGEKALILTRAGISAEEFEAYSEEIAAACWARSSKVYRHRARANLMIVEIVRRAEALGTGSSGLDGLYGRRAWVALRPEEPPDLRRPLVLRPTG